MIEVKCQKCPNIVISYPEGENGPGMVFMTLDMRGLCKACDHPFECEVAMFADEDRAYALLQSMRDAEQKTEG